MILKLNLYLLFFIPFYFYSQDVVGTIKNEKGEPIELGSVKLIETEYGANSDENGFFKISNVEPGTYTIQVTSFEYETFQKKIDISEKEVLEIHFILEKEYSEYDEVVVTGVTRGTKMKENPLAVSAISAKQIEETIAPNIIDVLQKNTPGLAVLKTGPNISKPFIRGLGYNRVLTLYDGVRQEGQQWGEEHGVEMDEYSIYRAEVIRGPASLMFGSDALAGVISFFPHLPVGDDGKLHGKLISEYHTNNGLIGNGLQVNYKRNNWLFGVNSSFRVAKNYQNPVDGRVYLTNFRVANFSVLAGHQTKKGHTHVRFSYYDNLQGIPDGSRDSTTRQFTQQIYEEDMDSDENRPIVSDQVLNSYKIPDLSQRIQHLRAHVHSKYEIGKGELDVLLAGQQNRRREYNHPTFPDMPGMHVLLNTLNYTIRYNTSLITNADIAFGVNGMGQNNKSIDATDFPIPDYSLFDLGAFIYGNWQKNKWTISGGVRYDFRNEKWDDMWLGENPVTGFDEVANDETIHNDLEFEKFNKNFHDVSASAGATYKITKNLALKANVGRSFRAPNITELASNGLDPGAHIIYIGNREFNPETSLQEDIGFSLDFPDFSFEINAFNNDINNYIFLSVKADDEGNPITDEMGNKTYQYLQSEANLWGGEFAGSFHPKAWKGFYISSQLSLVYGKNIEKEFKHQGTEGEFLPLIPPLQWTGIIAYEMEPKVSWIKHIQTQIEMEYAGKQRRFYGVNDTETYTPSYALLNLGVYFTFQYTKSNLMKVGVQVQNVLNRSYQNHLSRLKYLEDYENGNGIYNMGRNVAIKLILPF